MKKKYQLEDQFEGKLVLGVYKFFTDTSSPSNSLVPKSKYNYDWVLVEDEDQGDGFNKKTANLSLDDNNYMVEFLSQERFKILKINEGVKVRWVKLKQGEEVKFLSLENIIREID